MSKIKIIIIDDEPDSIEVIEILLANNQDVTVIGSANNVKDAITTIDKEKPDLVLLDIEMPGQSGFDLLNHYKHLPFKVIFTTGYNQYAIKAIKISALDYILKPIDRKELDFAIQKAIKQKDENERIAHLKKHAQSGFYNKIIIQFNTGFRSLYIDEIMSIESQSGNYALFYLVDGTKMLCTKPLKHYEEILSKNTFYRIHKSHIINLNRVTKFSNANNLVELSNGKTLEVAHRRKSKFYAAMNKCSTK